MKGPVPFEGCTQAAASARFAETQVDARHSRGSVAVARAPLDLDRVTEGAPERISSKIVEPCAEAVRRRLATQMLQCNDRERGRRLIVFVRAISGLENYFNAFSIRLRLMSAWEGALRSAIWRADRLQNCHGHHRRYKLLRAVAFLLPQRCCLGATSVAIR